ncbi:DUF2201 family putative metallopeptidase [Microbispora sp. CA-135349]|uniref:DUF2201 family putative metallopeptidase n=1 Tax=Microbispora sp. CA-135349 TaxID=3239953 RepID=UPI003D95094F
MTRGTQKDDPCRRDAALRGWEEVRSHPLFRHLGGYLYAADERELPHDRWAYITPAGSVYHHPGRRAEPGEWAWVFAHCLLHAGFGHLDPRKALPGDLYGEETPRREQPLRAPRHAYLAACCLSVDRFLTTLGIGRAPEPLPPAFPPEDERTLAGLWRTSGVPDEFDVPAFPDFFAGTVKTAKARNYEKEFAVGVCTAATTAIEVAGGVHDCVRGAAKKPWDHALTWFVSSYPLLGALAAGMTIVADAGLARARDIAVADAEAGEMYVNPLVSMTAEEWRFVLAREMLRAVLRHDERIGRREPYLWKVACDYAVNGWLVEMGVGEMPEGQLHDPALRGLSCEAVYDRIARDRRRLRGLTPPRGRGPGGLSGGPLPRPGALGRYVDLDEYYRNALVTGLAYHHNEGRGSLPAGLEQEIHALDHPLLPRKAALAR